MMKVCWKKHTLNFKFEARTSRGLLKQKSSYFIIIRGENGNTGIGECSLFPGLSIDNKVGFEAKLGSICVALQSHDDLDLGSLNAFLDDHVGNSWPAIRMGFETAFRDYIHKGNFVVYKNDFQRGKPIPINGLIWMGNKNFMLEQAKQKMDSGYSCIKMKIGALDFNTELDILRYMRDRFPAELLTLRVDANGAFKPDNVMEKLDHLAKLEIHSIEQPLKKGQWEKMKILCRNTPVPVGLDEELIGTYTFSQKKELVEIIQPQYLILKPSLLGGFTATEDWIKIAESNGIGWWITSALESNIGLNAICQFTYGQGIKTEQGLGTGKLFENNIGSPLEVTGGSIYYKKNGEWDLSALGVDDI